ncbi:MAG TPA: cation transporter [bacterium]|nr:cation transporter [bacterium]
MSGASRVHGTFGPRDLRPAPARAATLRAGIRIEWLTIAWMIVEAAVAIGAGVAAKSVALMAFGLDSVIELVSATVVLGRLRAEDRGVGITAEHVEHAERRASRVVGWSLFALAAYVVVHSAYDLLTHAGPESSPAGIAIAAAALLVMPPLVRAKRRISSALASTALRGDAAEGIVCAYMAATLLAGLVLRAAFGWWWADPAAALGIVYFIVREGREALAGGDTCC